MQSYQLVTKWTNWHRNSYGEESGKLSLISITSRRDYPKKGYKNFTIKNNGALIVKQ